MHLSTALTPLAHATRHAADGFVATVIADWPLIALCLLFFVGTLSASFLPFIIRFKEEYQAQMLSVVGAGLLTGAALQIIIPEGFEAFEHPPASLPGDESHAPHWLPGFVLTSGFLVMLVLDQVQNNITDTAQTFKYELAAANATEEGRSGGSDLGSAHVTASGGALSPRAVSPDAAFKVVLGLSIHAAADGLSLGAASVTGNHKLELVVTVAMVLHKMPVALGLATYLRQSRSPWKTTRRWLMYFSAATPVTTLLTYWALSLLPTAGSGQEGGMLVPACLLFSGGTVLYAACMHILPEAMGSHGNHTLLPSQVILFAAGCMLPLVLSVLPDHH